MPVLTVLMPMYNARKFLHEAIESILAQTFRDFEFLIIDDGSQDDSPAIVESYKDPRIRFLKNGENLGISATLNKGILLSQTQLIARMDANDISHPDRLQSQFNYMQDHPDCAMVSSLVEVISESGDFIRVDKFKSKYFYYNLNFICWIYHPTVMYRKQAVLEAGMYSVPYAEDFELFWQISRKHLIYNSPEVLLKYRVSNLSLHQVLRKKEYEQAQRSQLLRNFQYYTGYPINVPDSHLECLQHNFKPLLAEQNITSVLKCLRTLDKISECIITKENINQNIIAIKEAAYYKRNYILTFFEHNFPRRNAISLLLRDRKFSRLFLLATGYISRKFYSYIKMHFKNSFTNNSYL